MASPESNFEPTGRKQSAPGGDQHRLSAQAQRLVEATGKGLKSNQPPEQHVKANLLKLPADKSPTPFEVMDLTINYNLADLTRDRIKDGSMTQDEGNRFSQDMHTFETSRRQNLEELYKAQHKTWPDELIKAKAEEEIQQTYRHIGDLLAATEDSMRTPLTKRQLTELAEQTLHNAACPTEISQGYHSTCNVSTIERRAYMRIPSEAARLVADMSMTGKYTPAGRPQLTVHLLNDNITPDAEARKNPPGDGKRSFASQIFQTTAVNVLLSGYHQKYVQQERFTDRTDTGERMINQHGAVSTDHNPGEATYPQNEVWIGNTITGESGNHKWLLSDSAITNCETVKSADDVKHALLEAKKTGQFPLSVGVNCATGFLAADLSYKPGSAKDGGHVVSVTDYDPQSGKVFFVNEWRKADNHNGEPGSQLPISVEDLWGVMRNPHGDQTVFSDLEHQAKAAPAGFDRDMKELELLRLQRAEGTLRSNDKQYKTKFGTVAEKILGEGISGRFNTDQIARIWNLLDHMYSM